MIKYEKIFNEQYTLQMTYHVPEYVSSIHLVHYPHMLPNIPITV